MTSQVEVQPTNRDETAPPVFGREVGGRASRSLAPYPVTFALAVQYGLLVFWPAVRRDAPFSLVYSAPLVAIGISLYVETLMFHFRVHVHLPRSQVISASSGYGIALIGVVALVIQTALGAGTYGAQVGTRTVSPLAAVFTPFAFWALIGGGLVLFAFWRGTCSRARALAMVGSLVVFELLWSTFAIGRTAPGLSFAVTFAVGALTVRLVKARHVAVGALVILLGWPLLFQLRQETRAAAGLGPAAAKFQDADARLQLDLLLQLAEKVRIPADQLPSPLEILRYGLIPRVLDAGRPDLNVGSTFSQAIGSSSRNSVSFTTLGSLYAEAGWAAIAAFSAIVAWGIAVLLRRGDCWTFVASILAIYTLLWIETNYPSNVATLLQGLVSMEFAYLAIRGWSLLVTKRAT